MTRSLPIPVAAVLFLLRAATASAADPLPFDYRVETYRSEQGDDLAFALRLEQPFLAEEFEKSSYLRLRPLDEAAYLVYPRDTKFQQKHAEFYGRLRGKGQAKLKLSYEIVSENLDGSRKVDVREAEIAVDIPEQPIGSDSLFKAWANEQNRHFHELLKYYPEETFFEYVLLQSKDRYGVRAPSFERPDRSKDLTEQDLYYVFSGGLALQQSLQRHTLGGSMQPQDLTQHVSGIAPPIVLSPDYRALLEAAAKQGLTPHPHATAELIPDDQYFLQFNSLAAANDVLDLSLDWGESLLRLFTVQAVDTQVREKYQRQLCLDLDGLTQLFADRVASEFAVTGSDFFFVEGTDLTVLIQLEQPDAFAAAAATWRAAAHERRPDIESREFNYRGHKVSAEYTIDRAVSSFSIRTGNHAVYSNSHVGIRKIIDTLTDAHPSLAKAQDYQYVTALLPPSDAQPAGYLYCSDAFVRRLISPAFKIGEKRRLIAHSHLVMLNNASMMYRMESGKSPPSLSELETGRFVNLDKIRCPHGGAYAFDPAGDTATSSVFNRIKYLTPLAELEVLNVSAQERSEYDRYRSRYESFWRSGFDPIACRITTGDEISLESCFLPFANSSLYGDLRQVLDDSPQTLDLAGRPQSAVLSAAFVPGRKRLAEFIREIPGVDDALQADPTLQDLQWIGDRCTLHFCDADAILEVDPTQLRPITLFFPTSVLQQSFVAAGVAAANYPLCVTCDVEDEAKAGRLLEGLASQIFLEGANLGEFSTALDAYRVPDYQGHHVYVVSFQLYAAKIRFHVGIVGRRIIAATRPEILREAIDAQLANGQPDPITAHAVLQLDFRAMQQMQADLQLYWAEKSRQASHRNIMPIYNLIKLYGVDVSAVNALADAKYGVTYFCPDGEYRYDADRDQVYSTIYGNRQHASQNLELNPESSFSKFLDRVHTVTAALRFSDNALFTTIKIRRQP